jgi:hypothetical protein
MADNLFTTPLSSAAQNASINAYRAASTPTNSTPTPTAPTSTPSSSRGKKPPEFRYPQKALYNKTDYIKIDCYEYEPPGLNLPSEGSFTFAQNSSDDTYRSLSTKTIRGTLILPIPQTIPMSGQAVEWTGGKMGPLATATLGISEQTLKSQNYLKGLTSSLTSTILGVSKAAQTSLGQKAISTFFAAKAAEQLLGQDDLFNQALARSTGAVFNENVELLFRGITLRSAFDFTFDLAPRDEKEAQVIRNMIIFLKKEMSARKGNSGAGAGLFLTAPSVFKIQYMNGSKPHPYLNKFKICALQDLSLNFTASNTYTTYADGTPVHMQLVLRFQELTPIYNEDYAAQNETGVGY